MPGTFFSMSSRFSTPLVSSICRMQKISPCGLSGQTSAFW